MIKILLLSLLLAPSFFVQHQTGTLTIRINNFHHSEGKAVVNLFRQEDELPKKPFRQETGTITNDTATIIFTDLPYGNYAIILFHDENSNGELDHKLFFPDEPMGFSNGWNLTLFSGLPSFVKLRFAFSEQLSEQTIAVRD